MKHYRIGDLNITLDPGPIEIHDDLLTEGFLTSGAEMGPSLSIRCQMANLSFLRDWEIELYTGAYEIRRNGEQRFMLHHWMTHRYAFGLYLDQLFKRGSVCLCCNEEISEPIRMTAAQLLGAAGLHHHLLQEGCGVLHASYISHKEKGILFAAPSRTGKTTQAELWREHAGAEILNGDRALVFCRDGIWYGGGYIACGSSGICRNESYPLCAIVFLEQGKDNMVRSATGKERVHGLITGMETYHWSVEDMDLAFSLASRIGAEIPILHFSCRPDRDAVYSLEQYLEALSQC